jgi:2-polyprenyl-6-methoxyphenol hydroxylase-like FAD-dependent oxidoreductase
MGVAKAAADAMELRDALAEEPSVETALRRYNIRRIEAGSRIAHYGKRLGQSLHRETSEATHPSRADADDRF